MARTRGILLAAVVSLIAVGAEGARAQTTTSTNCATTQLRISIHGIPGGADHVGGLIQFRNLGATCVLTGYPGLDGVTGDGRIVARAKRTPRGYLGGGGEVRRIVLRPKATASALFEGLDGPPSGEKCAHYPDLEVTPPNAFRSVRVPNRGPCELQIHPVVVGSEGGAYALSH